MKFGKIGKDGRSRGAFVQIDGMSLSHLKDVCLKYDLPVSGTRPKLEARINKHLDKLRRDAQRQRLKDEKEAKREARKRKRQEQEHEAAGAAATAGPAPIQKKKRRRQQQQEPRAWASFLKGVDLDTIPFKRVKALAKRARVGAGGGRAACVERLRGFVELAKPPTWWVDAQAKAALVLTPDNADADGNIAMRVGQELVIWGDVGKCRSTSAALESSKPSGCVTESRRPKRIGFGRFKMTFTAQSPGHAVVHRLKNVRGVQDAMRPSTLVGNPLLITVSK